MIVIGKIINTYQQDDVVDEDDDDMNFDDVDIGNTAAVKGKSDKKTFCEVQVE